jgi:mannose-6-phosphate isomerase-like protein (cupin superfamily)
MERVDERERLAAFADAWSPHVVGTERPAGEGVKFRGEFVWYCHEREDELFPVVRGGLRMGFRDRHVWLEVGGFLIVPW